MGYEEDILRLVAGSQPTPTQEERARLFSEGQEARSRALAEEQGAEAMERGRASARLIRGSEHHIPQYPVIERYTNAFKGMGWHVLDVPTYLDENKDGATEYIGLTISGIVFSFAGIGVLPNIRQFPGKTLLYGANFEHYRRSDAVRLMEKEPFMMGVASLIAGHGPYHHDDYL